MTYVSTAVLALALCAAPSAAQPMGPGGPPGRHGPPAFLKRLYPPGLVMRNQDEITLTDAQRDAIKQAMADTERQLLDVRWSMEAEGEKLERLLDADPVDETAALAQVDRVMAAESQMKRRHLALLIRIKNLLTPEQRDRLRTLRGRVPIPGPPGEE